MASCRLTRAVRFRQTPAANRNYESTRTADLIEEKGPASTRACWL